MREKIKFEEEPPRGNLFDLIYLKKKLIEFFYFFILNY